MALKRAPNIPEREFKRLLKMVPFLCVDIVIVNKKGEFLLSKRTYPPKTGCWHVPGGFVGYNERLIDTAKRKALEETGLKIKIKKYLGYYDDPKQDSRGHVIVHAFLAKAVGGKLKNDSGLKWFKKRPKGMSFPFQVRQLKAAGLIK